MIIIAEFHVDSVFYFSYIESHIPQLSTQFCVEYQIRNSCKYVIYKDKKEFTADMKNIYYAPNKKVTAAKVDNLEKKWGGKYPYTILSWRNGVI